jgi:hypothetical protein
MTTKDTHIDSRCRVSIDKLSGLVEDALSFIERNPEFFACTWADLFKDTPEGDFTWDQDEAGDWIPWQDGGWTQSAYGMNLSRKGNKETVEFTSVDTDGNWDTGGCYVKTKGKALSTAERECIEFELARQHCYYNLLQIYRYNLYVVETGEDPLENTIGDKDPREVHSRDIAYEIPDLVASVYKTAVEALQKSKK